MTSLNGLNALVVDDIRTMHDLLGRMLRSIGFAETTGAVSGDEALEVIRSRRIDLALVDWNLSGITGGGMTGGDVVRRMRKENAALPILMVTGETGQATVLAARDAGADGYLVKPVSKAELAARVKFVLGKRAESAGPASSAKAPPQRAGK